MSFLNLVSAKRNRSDNFEADDIELLVGLVSEHTDIDSTKFEARRQAWESIVTKFNANCTGIKRDIGALKMKVKNMKSQAKKPKLEKSVEDSMCEIHVLAVSGEKSLDDNNEVALNEIDTNQGRSNEVDANQSHTIVTDTNQTLFNEIDATQSTSESVSKGRKRCKKFNKSEVDLLISLYESHCQGLDSSCTASSIKRRSDAWKSLTDDFNRLQKTGIIRDENELRIKIKNVKAMRVKNEPSSDNNTCHTSNSSSHASITSTPMAKIHSEQKPTLQQQTTSSRQSRIVNSIDIIADDLYEEEDYEEEYITPIALHKEDDKELEKVRRENILLKNAVLRKKERLLELQIALAERNLRRQI